MASTENVCWRQIDSLPVVFDDLAMARRAKTGRKPGDRRVKQRALEVPTEPLPKIYLLAWIKRAGTTQTKLAKAIKYGKSYINLIVSGERDNPSSHIMLLISRHFGITVNALYAPPPTTETFEAWRIAEGQKVAAYGERFLPPNFKN